MYEKTYEEKTCWASGGYQIRYSLDEQEWVSCDQCTDEECPRFKKKEPVVIHTRIERKAKSAIKILKQKNCSGISCTNCFAGPAAHCSIVRIQKPFPNKCIGVDGLEFFQKHLDSVQSILDPAEKGFREGQ